MLKRIVVLPALLMTGYLLIVARLAGHTAYHQGALRNSRLFGLCTLYLLACLNPYNRIDAGMHVS
jgi:hypothetical protein